MRRIVVHGPTTRGSGLRLVADALGVPAARVSRACPRCGSNAHGPITVSGLPERHWASVGHSGSATLVVVSTEGPIGVDLEESDAEATVALDRWVTVESALKATGLGLAVDPESVRLVEGSWSGRCVVAIGPDGSADRVLVERLDVPGHVARLAHLSGAGGVPSRRPTTG